MYTSPRSGPEPSGSTRRRAIAAWTIAGVLAAWGAGMHWLTGEVVAGLDTSLRLDPAVADTQHRADD